MKQNIRKFISLALTFALVATLLAGCKQSEGDDWISEVIYESDQGSTGTENGFTAASNNQDGKGNQNANQNANQNKDQNKNQNKSTNTSKGDNPLKADLGGKKITVYSYSDFTNVNAKASKTAAAQADMVKKLEKELNCDIVVKVYEPQSLYQQVLLNISSGTYFADMIIAPIYTSVGYISSKFTYNLAKIPTVDLSKNYMNVAGGVSAYKLGNGNWAVAEPLANSGFGNHLFVNKRILKEITGDENYVYNLMNKKQWNLTNFRNLAKKAVKDLDGVSGITIKDQLGIIQIDIGTSAYSNVLEAMGADMLKNNNGTIVYNMQDSRVTKAMDLARNIYGKTDGSCKAVGDSEAANAFRSGHGLFLGGAYMALLPSIADMDDEFGLVPYPTENSDKYSLPVNWNFGTIMIPSNLKSDQVKDAGAFLQAYCYLANNVINVKYDEWQSRYLCDDQSRKNLDICYKAVRITPAIVVGNSSLQTIYNGTYKVCYQHANGEDASTIIQSTAKAAQTGISDLNAKFK